MKSNVFEKVIFATVCVLCVFFLLGCVEPESGLNLAEELWGEWLRIDQDEAWYISRNSIRINERQTSKSVTLTRQSNNIIQVKEGGRIYYLYASRIANASFSGKVASFDDPASRSMARSVAGGKGWAKVVVENLDNGTSVTTTTDAEGEFTVDNIIPGDSYKITPEQGEPVIFTPVGNGDDTGTITVVEGDDVNFKVSIARSDYNSTDMTMLETQRYNDTGSFDFSYNFKITIQNTGKRDVTAATYQLSRDSGLSMVSGSSSGVLGTIEPGKSKTIDIKLRCSSGSINGVSEFKKINVTITDTIASRTWNDSVSLRFFKETISMGSLSGNARGMLITPANEARRSISGFVPKLNNEDYLFVFCGATADTEGAYSLRVLDLPYQDAALGTDLARYEPNDTEETAAVITGSIRAYLHKNDIDYYRFRLGGEDGSFSVFFNNNGGSNVPIQVINSGSTATRPANPTRSGYTFDDWYSDSGLTTVYNFSTPVTGNITLYAKWNFNSETLHVVPGGNLTEKFTWLKTNAVSGGSYIVETTGGSISPQSLSGRITITLKGSGSTRTVSLSSNGEMFTVNNGVTLILENINLQGRNNNNSALVRVSGGTLVMNSGSAITGNDNNGHGGIITNWGGGVFLGGGTFIMNGGAITGNTVDYALYGSFGGGVFVAGGGTFTMSGGVISGNTATCYSDRDGGGGVAVVRGIFAKTGGTIYGSGEGANSNITKRPNQGNAVYATNGTINNLGISSGSVKRQETTAGPEVDLLFYYDGSLSYWNGDWDY